jgi:hypothetical protein
MFLTTNPLSIQNNPFLSSIDIFRSETGKPGTVEHFCQVFQISYAPLTHILHVRSHGIDLNHRGKTYTFYVWSIDSEGKLVEYEAKLLKLAGGIGEYRGKVDHTKTIDFPAKPKHTEEKSESAKSEQESDRTTVS